MNLSDVYDHLNEVREKLEADHTEANRVAEELEAAAENARAYSAQVYEAYSEANTAVRLVGSMLVRESE